MVNKTTALEVNEMLNTRESAGLLNVTTQTIKNYIYSGKLRAFKTPGGHHRIRRSDLMSLGFIEDSGGTADPDALQGHHRPEGGGAIPARGGKPLSPLPGTQSRLCLLQGRRSPSHPAQSQFRADAGQAPGADPR